MTLAHELQFLVAYKEFSLKFIGPPLLQLQPPCVVVGPLTLNTFGGGVVISAVTPRPPLAPVDHLISPARYAQLSTDFD
jgi:hypothetical protein